MFDKRLMAMCPESKKYIAGNIICQWIEMMMNTIMIFIISKGIEKLYIGNLSTNESVVGIMVIEYVCTGHSGMHKMSDKIFAHIDESAKSTRKNPFDPTAPKSII